MNKLSRVLFLLKHKGLKSTYNKIYFYVSWAWIRGHTTICDFYLKHPPYPKYIEVEVSTRCNLKCVMCEHTYWKEPAVDMTLSQFKNIIDQFPGLVWIGLTGIGESFINNDFLDMLDYVKKRNITVELYDAFYYINPQVSKRLIDLGIDQMFISLDAATKETYESIRVGSDYDKVISNIKYMFELKKKNNITFPELTFHYIILKSNLHEVLQYIDLVYSIAGTTAPIQFSQMLHNHETVDHLFTVVPQETIDAIEHKANELGVEIHWNLDVPVDKPPMNRCVEWNMPFIFVNGDIIPCCASNESGNRDNQKKHKLGNIFKTPFKEIWNGKKYTALRNGLIKHKVTAACRNCCLYDIDGDKNK